MDYYEILQVHPKADADAIRAAYERLRDKYDPARLDGAADELVAIAQQRRATIEEAYGVLGDAERRREYDDGRWTTDNGRRATDDGRRATDDGASVRTVDQERGDKSVQRPSSVVDDPELDYRPLPPARRQERPKGFDVQPTLPQSVAARKGGRAAQRQPEQSAWTTPVLVTSGLIALIAAVSFFAAGLTIPNGVSDTRTSAGPAAQATAAAALGPQQPGSIEEVVNQFESLIPAAQQEARSSAQNPDSWIKLGNLLYDSAQVVRENMPNSPLYQQRLPRWLEASEAYGKALELQPDNSAVRSDRGVSLCYYGAGLKDQSFVAQGLKEAQQAAQQAVADPRVLFNLGICQSSTDPPQTEQALESWRQVAAMDQTAPGLATQAQRLIDQYSSP